MILLLLHALPFLLSVSIRAQQYPDVNCPNIFRYSYDLKFGGHYGSVTVTKDESSISELHVKMSMITKEHVNGNIRILVLTKSEEFFHQNSILRYAVIFPIESAIPKLTSLEFNGKILCSGTPYALQPGYIQTSMWAKSVVRTYGPYVSETNQHFPVQISPNPPLVLPNRPIIPQRPIPIAPNPIPAIVPAIQQPVSSPASPPLNNTPISTLKYQCGISGGPQQLILGGQKISFNDFPWLAAIMIKQQSNYKFQCTGNLISNKHVLTAGHCIEVSKKPRFDSDDIVIILGKVNLDDWAKEGTVKKAAKVVTHPNYKRNNADSDVAMIVLKEPLIFETKIRPVCLWNGEDLEEIVGKFGTIVGWGKEEDDVSTVAQKIEVPVVSQEDCLRSHKVFKQYTSSGTFCAGNRDILRGPCTGDSGAGFIIKDDATQKWFLRGLVGFSIRDPVSLSCDLGHYVILTDIAKTLHWINEEMRKY